MYMDNNVVQFYMGRLWKLKLNYILQDTNVKELYALVFQR